VTKQELSRLYELKSEEQRKLELAELTSEYDALKGYINSVEDSQMRKILQLKHEENLTWKQIATQVATITQQTTLENGTKGFSRKS